MEFGTSDIEKAKEFWRRVDVDHMFNKLKRYLNRLREMIKNDTATDREYIWCMTMVLESEIESCGDSEIDEVLIGSEVVPAPLTQPDCTLPTPGEEEVTEWEMGGLRREDRLREKRNKASADVPSVPTCAPVSESTAGSHEVIGPLVPMGPPFHPHDCTQACLPCLPSSADLFLGENPLKVPLLCQFLRLHATFPREGEAGPHVAYKAPCGRTLRNPSDVLRFLRETGSLGVLRLDNFSFSTDVLLEQRRDSERDGVLDADMSGGAEQTPVQLCNEVDSERPANFRYRKDRWPHSFFISPTPPFSAYCDCSDGCMDAASCSCLQISLRPGGGGVPGPYTHGRLLHPVPSGIYECGPWCGCDRDRCQNRLVQDGLRVRLQVFRTQDRGWGVRCRDDLDRGTFVCTYAGVLLWDRPTRHLPLKRKRDELPSDDEVEVVEEWKVPLEEAGATLDATPPASPTSHVSVIQRPVGLSSLVLDGEPEWAVDRAMDNSRSSSRNQKDSSYTHCTAELKHRDEDRGRCKALWEDTGEHLFYMDATEEGNVARFLNHSCQPNLFVQNVFVESQDHTFPTVAFFTSRPVEAGMELTWKYSYEPGSIPEQEVPCLCGSENCQGVII